LHFFPGLTSDHDPLTSAFWVAGITGIYHHARSWVLSCAINFLCILI
jgi:hypothetical protein